jgi:RNA polymerase subunit RPABC4/transcription elongation factor Spt4
MALPEEKTLVACPHCGKEVPAELKRCPNCGQHLPKKKREQWFSLKGLTPTEVFLLILGSIMLLIGLVAV